MITVYARFMYVYIDMFVFVDKSGSDNRDALYKYSYSLRVQPAKGISLFSRGNHR